MRHIPVKAVLLGSATAQLWWFAVDTAAPVPLLAGPLLLGGLWRLGRADRRPRLAETRVPFDATRGAAEVLLRVSNVISAGTPSRLGGPQ